MQLLVPPLFDVFKVKLGNIPPHFRWGRGERGGTLAAAHLFICTVSLIMYMFYLVKSTLGKIPSTYSKLYVHTDSFAAAGYKSPYTCIIHVQCGHIFFPHQLFTIPHPLSLIPQ